MKTLQLFMIFLRLGLTSFGGPIAHLGYFHQEFVRKRKWLSDQAYTDLVSLCQFLPGPASSQVGMGIGLSRLGIWGALVAWLGFTMPSALFLILFAAGITQVDLATADSFLHGLKVVAVAVVAQAVLGMGKKLCTDFTRIIIALFSCAAVLLFQAIWVQICVLICAALLGLIFLRPSAELPHEPLHHVRRGVGGLFLIIFVALLLFIPLFRSLLEHQGLNLFDSMYRSGALVFGGGHVVLPLLQVEVVANGWVSSDLFMAGYGIANALPGPLFTFSAYLGAISSKAPNGILGGMLCLVAIFLPSFLLLIGAAPFWERMRAIAKFRQAIAAINAAVVGILLAALYRPVWTSAIFSIGDFTLAAVGFVMLEFLKIPSWIVVIATALASYTLNL